MRVLSTVGSNKFVWTDHHLDYTAPEDDSLSSETASSEEHAHALKRTSLHPEDQKGHKAHVTRARQTSEHVGHAVDHYRSIGHNDFNRELRHPSHKGKIKGNGDYNFTDHSLHDLHKGLGHATSYQLKHKTAVYRGVGEAAHKIKALKKGDTFTDHGYTSTSHSPSVAISSFGHSEHTGTHREHHVVKIHLPKGSKIMHVPHHVDDGLTRHEAETVLHHGNKFKVLGHSVHDLPGSPSGHSSSFDSTKHRVHVTHVKLVKQRK